MKKRIFWALIVVLIAIAGYVLVIEHYPKSAGRYPFLLLLLLTDFFVFISLRLHRYPKNIVIRTTLQVIYWSPTATLMGIAAVSLITPYYNLPDFWRIYLPGFVFTGFASKIIPFLFILPDYTIKLLRRIVFNKSSKVVSEPHQACPAGMFINTGAFLGGLVFIMLIWGMTCGNSKLRVYETSIVYPGLPEGLEEFRIVQVSDLHLGSWYTVKSLEEMAETVNRLDPDIFVFTGDLVNYSTDEAYRFEPALSHIRSRFGSFAIAGNHDYGDYRQWENEEEKENNWQALAELYDRIGWKLLLNSNQPISVNGTSLAVIGVENWGGHSRFQKKGDILTAYQGAGGADFRILLSHDPSHWELIVSQMKEPVELTLSGHTHAFQFGIETSYFRWSPAKLMYRYWAGKYSVEVADGTGIKYLYVNRGTGMIGYPGRIGIAPEITLITLTRGASQ